MIGNFGKFKVAAILLFLIALAFYTVQFFISEDRSNNISRLGISFLSGDYRVTYTGYNGDKIWFVKDGKVTSVPGKGYYFFWVSDPKSGNKQYVQVPMTNTYIEEVN